MHTYGLHGQSLATRLEYSQPLAACTSAFPNLATPSLLCLKREMNQATRFICSRSLAAPPLIEYIFKTNQSITDLTLTKYKPSLTLAAQHIGNFHGTMAVNNPSHSLATPNWMLQLPWQSIVINISNHSAFRYLCTLYLKLTVICLFDIHFTMVTVVRLIILFNEQSSCRWFVMPWYWCQFSLQLQHIDISILSHIKLSAKYM